MVVQNIGSSGSIDPSGGDLPRRVDAKPAYVIPTAPQDDAQISAAGRQTAATVQKLAERARGDDGDRDAKIALAIEKLGSGELDSSEVLAATARRLFGNGFVSG